MTAVSTSHYTVSQNSGVDMSSVAGPTDEVRREVAKDIEERRAEIQANVIASLTESGSCGFEERVARRAGVSVSQLRDLGGVNPRNDV